MNTILLFFRPYDLFSGKFQLAHFALFRNVSLRKSYSTVQVHFIKYSGNSVPGYALALLPLANRSSFDSLPIHLSSFEVLFQDLPGGLLASHDADYPVFLKHYE